MKSKEERKLNLTTSEFIKKNANERKNLFTMVANWEEK